MGVISPSRRVPRLVLLVSVCLAVIYFLGSGIRHRARGRWRIGPPWGFRQGADFDWANRPMRHPMADGEITYPPEGPPRRLPRIQHDFSQDPPPDPERAQELEARQRAVRNSFRKCWESYKEYAWGYDELLPDSLGAVDTFAGWAATLVDSLDVLWIMGLEEEFRQAAEFVDTIDWDKSTADKCSVFETNIRYMGGLLAAHDLSGEPALLDKALELGQVLFSAFDTENHLPTNTLYFGKAKKQGGGFMPSSHESSANVGSLSLEFIRLSQLTDDPRFFSVVNRIKMELDRTQDVTKLPGMWPRYIDLLNGFMTEDSWFTLNAPADSLYEYLAKSHMIMGGLDPAYERMYRKAMDTVRKHVLFRPIVPGNEDILMAGVVGVNGQGQPTTTPEIQHLGCFAGGMFALGGRLFRIEDYVATGERLARGCAWAYNATGTGIMPEQFKVLPCEEPDSGACDWASVEDGWETGRYKGYPKGITSIWDKRYVLRPEAIESIFYLYRITGNTELQDIAWRMFQSIRAATETDFAFSAISDVTTTGKTYKEDSMESFWFAETLKYFYLIFSDPDVISLDDYVLNTEAHPFKIPKP